MAILRGIIQFRSHSNQRARLRKLAEQFRCARISAHSDGSPLIAFVMSPEDRELITDALYTIAEAVVDE